MRALVEEFRKKRGTGFYAEGGRGTEITEKRWVHCTVEERRRGASSREMSLTYPARRGGTLLSFPTEFGVDRGAQDAGENEKGGATNPTAQTE
jgi:hypothetical protein